ncbi:alpha/beta hydrolase [Sporolactobacillus sp. THM7-4]|nr:alpha/beta hydrolase [Sporolactobacillus sp. THM7-4]
MKKIYLKTSKGTFTCFSTEQISKSNPTIVFFPAMGINSAYLDFYNVFNFLDEKKFNLLSVDMLGSGFSADPVYRPRTLENYSEEISKLLAQVPGSKLFIVSHSFSAIYLLNVISQKPTTFKISGFIGIDPTSSEIMIHHQNDLENNLAEAKKNRESNIEMDADINPGLPDSLISQAQDLYRRKSGNPFEINELEESIKTIKKTEKMKINSNLPTLSILSSLNYPNYVKWGNPYFNQNNSSFQVVLNGHHFLQWLHPQLIANLISVFNCSLINSAKTRTEEENNGAR